MRLFMGLREDVNLYGRLVKERDVPVIVRASIIMLKLGRLLRKEIDNGPT
jgi:hypothetical protein